MYTCITRTVNLKTQQRQINSKILKFSRTVLHSKPPGGNW